MSRLATTLIASVFTITPVAALAQFGLPSLPGMGGKSAGGADLSGSQDQLVRQYVDANKTVMLANAHMADAMGLKDDAAKLRASSDSLGDGATKGNLADADKATSDTNRKLAEKLNDNTVVLDADAKKKYVAGLVTMASGVVKYVGMKGSFQSFASNLKGVSPMMLPKLQTGVYIVSSLPANVKNLTAALSSATQFAKSHDIEVPKDVTAAMGAAF
jgi:hypothetical protein